MSRIAPRDRLIVGLDVPSVAEAEKVVGQLGDSVSFYKIGLQLLFAGGLDLARRLADSGKKVFLDVKLLDIDNTVAGAVGSLAGMGMSFVTVHAYPKAMRAAVAARGQAPLGLLAVTVLTSMDNDDVAEAGYAGKVDELVLRRATDARTAGMDGIVAAPSEAAAIRALVGPAMPIITPGIRPAGTDAGDQKRIATPAAAIQAGADYLVVGRPVTAAADPRRAAAGIVREIESALAGNDNRGDNGGGHSGGNGGKP
jgi:orotidine-5'-phosphate decarboxylase